MSHLTVSKLKYRAWFLVKHRDPEDESLALDAAGRLMTDVVGDGLSTAEFAVFSKAVRGAVTELPTSATIKVENAGLFKQGDNVEVIKNDNVAVYGILAADGDATAGTIVLPATPSPQLTVRSLIRKTYGTPTSERKSMVLGGETPRAGDSNWYWQALGDPNVYSDLVPGLEVEFESIAVKSGGTKINSIASICLTVEADCA